MKDFLILLFIITSCNLMGQKDSDFILSSQSDTNFWYNYHMEDIARLNYIKPIENIDFFRISSSNYYLQISQGKIGKISLYVQEMYKCMETGEVFIKAYELDSSQCERIIKLMDSLEINKIPSDKYIANWKQGFDGKTYFIEVKDGNVFTFKKYWTPTAQANFKESIAILSFMEQLDKIVNYQEIRKLFENEMPFYAWSYKGSRLTTGTNPKTKEYKKYKRKMEKQLERNQ